MDNEIGICLSSGVLQPDRFSDGIGDLAAVLEKIPGVSVKLNRIIDNRLRMRAAEQEAVDWLKRFKHRFLAGHSKGGDFVCNVAWILCSPVRGLFLADPWTRKKELSVPTNVLRGESWTQTHNRPRGAHPYWKPPTLWVAHPALTEVGHNEMDSWPEFHDAIFNAVRAAKGES